MCVISFLDRLDVRVVESPLAVGRRGVWVSGQRQQQQPSPPPPALHCRRVCRLAVHHHRLIAFHSTATSTHPRTTGTDTRPLPPSLLPSVRSERNRTAATDSTHASSLHTQHTHTAIHLAHTQTHSSHSRRRRLCLRRHCRSDSDRSDSTATARWPLLAAAAPRTSVTITASPLPITPHDDDMHAR